MFWLKLATKAMLLMVYGKMRINEGIMPDMISLLDQTRDMLEELSPELGV